MPDPILTGRLPLLDVDELLALCDLDAVAAYQAMEAHTNRAYGLEWCPGDLPSEVDDLLTSTWWSDSTLDDVGDLAKAQDSDDYDP